MEGEPATGAAARTANTSEDGIRHVDVVPIMHVLLDSNGRFTGLGRFGKVESGEADREAREKWAEVAHYSDVSITGLYDDIGTAVKESLCHCIMLCAAWLHDQDLFEPTWIVEGTMPSGLGYVRRLRKRKGQEKALLPLLCDGKRMAPGVFLFASSGSTLAVLHQVLTGSSHPGSGPAWTLASSRRLTELRLQIKLTGWIDRYRRPNSKGLVNRPVRPTQPDGRASNSNDSVSPQVDATDPGVEGKTQGMPVLRHMRLKNCLCHKPEVVVGGSCIPPVCIRLNRLVAADPRRDPFCILSHAFRVHSFMCYPKWLQNGQ